MLKSDTSCRRVGRPVSGIIIVLTLLLAAAGCSKNDQFTETTGQHTQAGATETAPTGSAATTAPAMIEGSITKTMDSGGYTYALIRTATDTVWTAGPVSAIEPGMEVSLPTNMPMRDFHSKTLGRTFPIIYFVPAFATPPAGDVTQSEEFKKAHEGMNLGQSGNVSTPVSGTQTVLDREVIGDFEKAPGGYTIAEIYAQRADLSGKPVKVRGVVVKFTPSIMGTNWVHLQDGTGEEGSHDLTVTTNSTVKNGDLIMIQGVLAVDKDFGAGYRYQVIVEAAEIIRD